MKSLRLKHYSYIVMTAILLIISFGGAIINLRVARAEESQVTITSPTPNQKLDQESTNITGTAPALKKIIIFDDKTKLGTVSSNSEGNWSYTWSSPSPGAHKLRAVLVDGSIYSSYPFEQNSVKTQNINSGQIDQNYSAGLSGLSALNYDKDTNEIYTVNMSAGTVSVINASSHEITDTIVFSSDLTSKLANNLPSLCYGELVYNIVSCPTLYDEENNKLYIMTASQSGVATIYVVDTQSKSLVSTISDINIVTTGEQSIPPWVYRLYMDPSKDYLYLSRVDNISNDDPEANGTGNTIVRISLSNNAVDSGWQEVGNSLVATSDGDVYFARVGSSLSVWRSDTQSVSEIDLSSVSGSCQQSVTDLALSSDGSKILANCESDSSLKLVTINPSDGTILDSFDSGSYMLNSGNIVGEKLYLLSHSRNTVVVYNTSSNSMESSITNLPGYVAPNYVDNLSGSTAGLYSKSAYIDATANRLYLITSSVSGSSDIHNQLVSVDTSNTSNSITDSFDYPDTGFYTMTSMEGTGSNEIALISTLDNNTIYFLNKQTGLKRVLNSGMGFTTNVDEIDETDKLYSYDRLKFISSISVGDIEAGSYQKSIKLPTKMWIYDSAFNSDKSKYYVAGPTLTFDPSSINPVLGYSPLTILEIDTTTDTVSRVFNGLADQNINTDTLIQTYVSFSKSFMSVLGDKIYLADSQKLYTLDLNTDLATSMQINEDTESNNLITMSSKNVQDKVILLVPDSSGNRKISIRNISDLSEIESLDTSGYANSTNQIYTADYINDHLIALGESGFAAVRLVILDTDTNKTVAVLNQTQDVFGACAPIKSHINSSDILAFNVFCAGLNGEFSAHMAFFDLQEKLALTDASFHTSDFGSLAGLDDRSRFLQTLFGLGIVSGSDANYSVASATQDVTVLANKVTITKPAAGTKLKPGEYTIKGTAPPNKTVTVKVDGKTIGTTGSDQYGIWSKKHTFTTGEHQIKANYTEPSQDTVFMHMLDDSNSPVIYALNATTGDYEAQISLPHESYSTFSFIDHDNNQLIVFGISQTTQKVYVFKYSLPNYSLVSEVETELSIDDALASKFSLPTLTADKQFMYITNATSLLKVSLSNGSITKSIDLGQEFADSNVSQMSVRAAPIMVGTSVNILAPYGNCHGQTVVDLDAENVIQQVSTGETGCLIKGISDQADGTLYYYVTNTDGGVVTNYLGSTNPFTGDLKWQVELDGYVGINPGMIESSDGKSLYLIGSKVVGGGNYALTVLRANKETGEIIESSKQVSIDIVSQIAEVTSGGSGIYSSLAINDTGDVLYNALSVYGSGGLVGKYDLKSEEYSIIKHDNTDLIYGNYADNFVTTTAGNDLNATRNVTVLGPAVTDPKPEDELPAPPPTTCVTCTITETINKKPTTKLKKSTKAAVIQFEKPSSIESLFAKLFAATKRFVVSVPLPLVNAFPYLLLLLIVLLIAYYLYQTQKQLKREDSLRNIYEKQKILAEEKRNFLELASHYLRTPLTYIKAGSEMILRNKQNENAATELTESVGHLSLFIESLIEEASSNDDLQILEDPKQKIWSPLLQKSFLVPVALLVGTLLIFYAIFGLIGGVNFGPARYVTQILLMFVIVQLFYGMFKNHHGILHEEELLSKTINAETGLDHARAKLMKDAGSQLQTRTNHLAGVIKKLESADTSKAIMEQGVDRLKELSQAFMLVSHLEGETVDGKIAPVSVRTLAAEVIEPLAEKLRQKKVKVEISGFDQDATLKTNRSLAELTLKTLLENALQASQEGACLVVKCIHKEGRVAFQVIDHGAGIPKDKIERLFKPFVKVGPVTTFNREGIGLSLYLDRLIMHSLGGEIEIVSRFKKGTTATLTFSEKTAS